MSDSLPPRPWRWVIGDDHECWGIIDAKGQRVVETDCGFYPPNLETAKLIVTAVNAYVPSEPRPK